MTDVLERETGDPGGPDDADLTMGIDPWERNWMLFSVVLLVVFAAAVTIAGFAAGFQLPGAESEVDPRTIASEGRWAEPGLREVGDGQFEAYVMSQLWSFSPRELVVPIDAEVDIYVTSQDLQHGFKITDTNVNMQVVPGQVSKLTYTFDEVGEFPYICTEYCGQGHAAMFGTVRVVSEAEFEALQSGDGVTTGDDADAGGEAAAATEDDG
ncbi:MAG: cytochrome c oxidase subunit II [Ilumatobacter sp.]|uniref:cytochrome c oxidase subunit II n=1 Tax=Ilumatobacter sp. TaxID=1967498 RepID=UPI0026296E1F|nr:cytochrome c oxidase subunit II [Ilumatobacter sp.]MDJ0767570.1 cytochrome c oxidase subunit II [Ilumatobacter sp.]